MNREAYDAIIATNWSSLKTMAESPAHYRHSLLTETREQTDPMLVGEALHVATLEPAHLDERFICYPERRAGKDWDAFQAAYKTKKILTAKQWHDVQSMTAAVRRDPIAKKYIVGGEPEVTLRWTTERDGYRVECKGRLDYLVPHATVDLKSAVDGSPDGFGRDAFKMLYHGQGAWYHDGLLLARGEDRPFVFVVVEKSPPYLVQVYTLEAADLLMGRELYEGLLDKREACRRADAWPGYGTGELPLTLPRWAYFDESEGRLDDLGMEEAG